jgi:hypothetical protein
MRRVVFLTVLGTGVVAIACLAWAVDGVRWLATGHAS